MGHKAFQFGETSDYLQSISETSREILEDISSQTNLITYLSYARGFTNCSFRQNIKCK
jgi:hypothetical protein